MSSTPGRSAPALVRTTDFGRWVDAVNCHFLPLEASTAQRQRYQGGFRVRPLDSAAAGLVWTSPCAVTRSRRQADAAEHGYFKILWQLTGHSQLAQRGRSLPIAPGTVAVYDATQPYRLDMSDACRFAVLTLSTDAHPAWRTLLESRGPQLAGPGAATRAGLAALLSLLRGPDDKAGADAVAETIGALVMAALACGDKPPRPPATNCGWNRRSARCCATWTIRRWAPTCLPAPWACRAAPSICCSAATAPRPPPSSWKRACSAAAPPSRIQCAAAHPHRDRLRPRLLRQRLFQPRLPRPLRRVSERLAQPVCGRGHG